MARRRKQVQTARTPSEILLELQSPEIGQFMEEFQKRYGGDPIPLDELRKEVAQELGDKTLNEALFAMREGRSWA